MLSIDRKALKSMPAVAGETALSLFVAVPPCPAWTWHVLWTMRATLSVAIYALCKNLAVSVTSGVLSLLAVIGNLVQGKWELPSIFLGIATSVLFFIGAYTLEGGKSNE